MISFSATSIAENTSWVVYPRPNPTARMRLFCFPYAGSSDLIFRSWPEAMPPQVEVCAIRLPGRGTRLRERSFTNLSMLIDVLAPHLLPHLDKPFSFFGHSMGALVGFELARRLRKQHDLQPAHMFVSARGAPHLPPASRLIYQLAEEEFIQELRAFKGTPQRVLDSVELLQLLLPTLRADIQACETYVHIDDAPFDYPISAFGGLQDYSVRREHLDAWRGYTSADFSLRIFPGDHFFLHSAQPMLLAALSQQIARTIRVQS